ncbi:uncharacterized protein LOC141904564 [Tubulanus polymorphus]|uniref:uncharacterized protein LOC141904564 n=1 Tax=Tubulanus polymorphus TaxID=672921 RepID=UPI003DA59F63
MADTEKVKAASAHLFNEVPPQPPKKPGQLPIEKIKQFFEEGYMVIEDFFTKEELDPCVEAINALVDDLAEDLYKNGKIKNKYKEYGFKQRLTKLNKEFPGANIVLIKKYGVLPQPLKDLWTNERLLNVVEQLIGPEIGGHPVWNIRVKCPQNEATVVPWHQDSAYLDTDSYNVLQPTAWIPFLDANANNGCMQLARYGHKSGKIATHTCCDGQTWYVTLSEEEMEKTLGVDLKKDIITVPVPYGGLLMFSNVLPHQSLPNISDEIRWSIDLRWQRPDHPYGFYGVKDGILMRTSADPDYKIDWTKFDGVNRNKAHIIEEHDDYDTTVTGPWMDRWNLVNTNRHTAAYKKDDADSWSRV